MISEKYTMLFFNKDNLYKKQKPPEKAAFAIERNRTILW
jgi:hypothetical protein